MSRLSLSLLSFVGNILYESHITYDVLSTQTDVNVNCHQASAFHSQADRIPLSWALETQEHFQQKSWQQIRDRKGQRQPGGVVDT